MSSIRILSVLCREVAVLETSKGVAFKYYSGLCSQFITLHVIYPGVVLVSYRPITWEAEDSRNS